MKKLHLTLGIVETAILYIFLLFPSISAFAEGSDEIYVDKSNANTRLFLCNDFDGQCGGSSGIRTQFAIYDCAETDRLYFVTSNPNEIVYMGFNGDDNGGWFDDFFIVYRLRNMAGDIVQPELELPTGGTGFINSIDEARVGPLQIAGGGGYDAIVFNPSEPGTYYVEFDRMDRETGGRAEGSFYIELIDITVYDTVENEIKIGRLHSKGWQFSEVSAGFDWTRNSSTFYVYSEDSIITSVEFEDMEGRAWIMFCNQTGCDNTGNAEEDRKSVDTEQAYFPQYRIFVNPPDENIFPPAISTGQIVSPDPWGETFCNNGNILFHVNVDKAGNVDITLDFANPYVDRTLPALVVIGENLILWDGLDGAGIPVPNNTSIEFTITYISGLTNLPLYDIEGNVNGFRIGLISPPGPTPLVYWDDSNILGNNGEPIGTVNFTGCLSVPPEPGCHSWTTANNSEYGDQNTINTWWFTASNSTVPVTIYQKRKAGTLSFVQTPPQNYCAGSFSVMFSVTPEPNTEVYHWGYTGTGVTITQVNPTDNFITVDFSPTATSGNITVYGTNTNCPNPGPTSQLAVNIFPLPEAAMIVSPNDTVCTNETVTFNGFENTGITVDSWFWDFGDGSSDNNQNTTHIYTAPLSDTVKLIVTTSDGCVDTAFLPITVIDVDVDFTISPNPSCTGYEVTLNGTGTVTFTDWIWDFGDGNTGTGKNITHTYTSDGTYDIMLTVCSESVTHQITVNPLPTADAGTDQATCEDVFFDLSTSIIPPSASNYSSIFWYGGTGSFNNPTLVAPIYTPGATELGLVTLTMVAYGIAPWGDPYDFANSSVEPFSTNYIFIEWSGGAGTFIDPHVQVPVYIPAPDELGAITLQVVASNILNCDSIDEMVLTIHPKFTTTNDVTICYGDSLFVQGNWQFSSGTYFDTVMSVNNCDSAIITNLTVLPQIDMDFNPGSGTSVMAILLHSKTLPMLIRIQEPIQ